jgi:hypothetical protein
LVSALRAAAGCSPLPFEELIKPRPFPLLRSKETNGEDGGSVDYEGIVDDFARLGMQGQDNEMTNIQTNASQSIQDSIHGKMRRLFPELVYMNGQKTPPVDQVCTNISIRHVQPMVSGPPFVFKNNIVVPEEVLLKRSGATFRKVLYEQTTKMFRPVSQKTVVYDVMNPSIAKEIESNRSALLFESRFESGNLQLAIKISQYEYELIVQSDINSLPGQHNQWFYFSVRNMDIDVVYRFHIVNLSKPGSQFNNGMQPVMYSQLDPGWKRVGDHVFYIK